MTAPAVPLQGCQKVVVVPRRLSADMASRLGGVGVKGAGPEVGEGVTPG